jgi:hypothetical protein
MLFSSIIYGRQEAKRWDTTAAKYKNIQVEDGLACEWFERGGEYKLSPESPPADWHAKGLDVLKRQSDGSWKGVMVFVNQ